MKAYINIRVVVDSKKKLIVAKSKTRIDRAEFLDQTVVNTHNSSKDVDELPAKVFNKAMRHLETYGELFSS